VKQFGGGGWTRTNDLRIMSQDTDSENNCSVSHDGCFWIPSSPRLELLTVRCCFLGNRFWGMSRRIVVVPIAFFNFDVARLLSISYSA
jgi:hypothetical protein